MNINFKIAIGLPLTAVLCLPLTGRSQELAVPAAVPAALQGTPVQATSTQTNPLTAAPGPAVHLRLHNGRPTVLENGRPVPMAAYDNSIMRQDVWKQWTDHFINSGIRVFHLTPAHYKGTYGQSRFWTDEDVYPAPPPPPASDLQPTMDRQAAYILSRVPDARFIVRLKSYAPTPWREKNPGELQTDGKGKTYEPSWASQKYLDGITGHYRNLVGWAEAQPWGSRVLGYFIMPYGEGLTIHSIEGNFFDHSPAMQRAWSGWLKREYASDAALRAAWADEKAVLESAPIPDDAALRAKLETLPYWPDPSALRRERDYVRLQRELFGRYVRTLTRAVKGALKRPAIVGLDAMKQPLLGWQINEAFFGKGRNNSEFEMFLSSGSYDVGELLDLPDLDCLVTPADYTARGMGYAFEGEGLADSLVLRGKTLFIENDARTWLARETDPDRKPPLGSFMTVPETRAGLLRNTGQALSRGLMYYWTDINYPTSFYSEPSLQTEIQRNRDAQTRAVNWPHRETEHAIAVIIDDQSLVHTNFSTGFNNLAVIRQRVEGLGQAGIPYRLYLLSDLKKENFPAYRCYFFPNLFKVDNETIALLKQKVLRDGRIAIFGPGTGITDGQTVSAAPATRLLQIPMKLHNLTAARRIRVRRDVLEQLGGTDPAEKHGVQPFYGDSLAYGPILAPDREQLAAQHVQVLGDLTSSWQVNAPGLVLREFGRGLSGGRRTGNRARGTGDYGVVFTAALPLPPSLLRSLARLGGCNVWAGDDAVISASDTVVSLHSTVSGPHTIRLPRRVGRVYDGTTGRLVGRNLSEINLTLQAPETRLFFLD